MPKDEEKEFPHRQLRCYKENDQAARICRSCFENKSKVLLQDNMLAAAARCNRDYPNPGLEEKKNDSAPKAVAVGSHGAQA